MPSVNTSLPLLAVGYAEDKGTKQNTRMLRFSTVYSHTVQGQSPTHLKLQFV